MNICICPRSYCFVRGYVSGLYTAYYFRAVNQLHTWIAFAGEGEVKLHGIFSDVKCGRPSGPFVPFSPATFNRGHCCNVWEMLKVKINCPQLACTLGGRE